ncbi:transcription elongation factor A protein 3 isoform X1 [Monodelphis domestica]|uniref:transcription elongation factor A protein 3 isoform X1 n=1 Tax=Monodelphis domestica TaxID=13616 RepID=UPI0024E24D20|nr:transcription elongation factor A protein 3 isoform X1 [Monodelphis domestica]
MGQEEELLRIAKKLDKMVSRKNTEGALDLLKKLSDYKMSIQLLQTTRIGIAVNGVRKHCLDKEVVALAKILIKNWKRLLDTSETPKKEKAMEREKEKKKEQNVDLSDWKPLEAFSPPSRSPREEPKDRKCIYVSLPDAKPCHSGARNLAVLPGADLILEGASPHPKLFDSSRRDSSESGSSSSAVSSPSLQKRPVERSNSSKGKVETPKTPTSPSSPTFSPSACCLAPCYLTGDSVRDKCVEMLSAALKMDDDYKEYGVNCDKMASEIEDHILSGVHWLPGGRPSCLGVPRRALGACLLPVAHGG